MIEHLKIRDKIMEGRREKAIEDAIVLIRDFNVAPEIAAQKMNAPLDLVLEALKKQPEPVQA